MTYQFPKEFTVYRSRWIRGQAIGFLHKFNKHCCVGFYALACGFTERQLEEVGRFETLAFESRHLGVSMEEKTKILHMDHTFFSGNKDNYETRAYKVNDNPDITDEEREAQLTAIFAEADVVVHFKD